MSRLRTRREFARVRASEASIFLSRAGARPPRRPVIRPLPSMMIAMCWGTSISASIIRWTAWGSPSASANRLLSMPGCSSRPATAARPRSLDLEDLGLFPDAGLVGHLDEVVGDLLEVV